jgi:hypothetical protein
MNFLHLQHAPVDIYQDLQERKNQREAVSSTGWVLSSFFPKNNNQCSAKQGNKETLGQENQSHLTPASTMASIFNSMVHPITSRAIHHNHNHNNSCKVHWAVLE